MIFEDDFIPHWDSQTSNWSVVSSTNYLTNSAAEFTASSGARHLLSYKDLSVIDVEILALVKVPNDDCNSFGATRLIGRASGESSTESGYFSSIDRSENNYFPTLNVYDAGTSITLATGSNISFIDTRFWMKLRLNGSSIQFKLWEYGTSEPVSWNLDVTDTTIGTEGYFGVGSFSSCTQYYEFLSIAMDTETLQYPSIAGNVTNQGVPVENAIVEATEHSSITPNVTTTNSNGGYIFTDLSSGNYDISTVGPDDETTYNKPYTVVE